MLYMFLIAVIGLVQLQFRKHLELDKPVPKREKLKRGDEYASWVENYIRGEH